MKFFNPKEEVLDIKLTQFGKHLLSIGKWKPVYYAFFDDNILYDAQFAGTASAIEAQNNIETRIQELTPQLHTQYNHAGLETSYIRIVEERTSDRTLREDERIRMQSTAEKDYSLVAPLGNSELGQKNSPQWSLTVLSGEISGSATTLTGSYQTLHIPQVEMDLTYRVLPRQTSDLAANSQFFGQIEAEEILAGVFPDQTYLDVIPANILAELKELNTSFDVENFDIEVYKFERDKLPGKHNPTVENLTQLFFGKQKQQIQNNILLTDEPEHQAIPYDETYVEYYFNVYTDDEVDPDAICDALHVLKSQGIYVDTEYDCPEAPINTVTMSPYEAPSDVSIICSDDDPTTPPKTSIVPSKPGYNINNDDQFGS